MTVPTKAELLQDLKTIGKQVKLFGDPEMAAYSRLKSAIEAQTEGEQEPVAWQWRMRARAPRWAAHTDYGPWRPWTEWRTGKHGMSNLKMDCEEYEERALYASHPASQQVESTHD